MKKNNNTCPIIKRSFNFSLLHSNTVSSPTPVDGWSSLVNSCNSEYDTRIDSFTQRSNKVRKNNMNEDRQEEDDDDEDKENEENYSTDSDELDSDLSDTDDVVEDGIFKVYTRNNGGGGGGWGLYSTTTLNSDGEYDDIDDTL